MIYSRSIRTKNGDVVSFELDWDTNTCHIPVGCVKQKFELEDVVTLKTYHIPKPESGWKIEFTDEEKYKLQPIAETLAMLDGNAFFGNTITSDDGVEFDWYEMYLPEAYALYQSNGGDSGWAGDSSIAKRGR